MNYSKETVSEFIKNSDKLAVKFMLGFDGKGLLLKRKESGEVLYHATLLTNYVILDAFGDYLSTQ